MKVRRLTPLLVAVPVLTGLLAGPVGAQSVPTDRSYTPMARAPEDGDSADAKDKKAKEQEPEPCPQDMWTVPLEVEGLACVLLVPKDDPSKDDKKDDNKGDNDKSSGRS